MAIQLSSDYESRLRKELEKILDPQMITKEKIASLVIYTKELFLWNEKINLVGDLRAPFLSQIEKEDLFISRHVVDSLSALPIMIQKVENCEQRIDRIHGCDVGSGAGLPGIPLAIFTPEWEWCLIERGAKRCGFLRNVIALTGLFSRVSLYEGELESIGKNFPVVVFRAFRPFDLFFASLSNLLNTEGWLFAYKGKREILEKEIELLKEELAERSWGILPLSKTKEERTLFCFQKKIG